MIKSGYLRGNLPRINDGGYVIDLNDKQSKGTHWTSLFIDRNTVVYVYLDSFEIKYILVEVLSTLKERSLTRNTRRCKMMILRCVDFIVLLL